jgi:hypothetical protein
MTLRVLYLAGHLYFDLDGTGGFEGHELRLCGLRPVVIVLLKERIDRRALPGLRVRRTQTDLVSLRKRRSIRSRHDLYLSGCGCDQPYQQP